MNPNTPHVKSWGVFLCLFRSDFNILRIRNPIFSLKMTQMSADIILYKVFTFFLQPFIIDVNFESYQFLLVHYMTQTSVEKCEICLKFL